MKFYDYQHYLNYYTEEFTYLGERGDSRYYDDKTQDHIVKVPSESSRWCDGNHQGTQPTIFYHPESVKALRDVWQHEWDYEDADMFAFLIKAILLVVFGYIGMVVLWRLVGAPLMGCAG